MATKCDLLTEDELASFHISPVIGKTIEQFCQGTTSCLPKEQTNVLDWGCGRGRSVAKLLEQGFNAYGVDIDRSVMQNGYEVFRNRGYDPNRRLMHVNDLVDFANGFFHIVFSEQVLEHVQDLQRFSSEIFRLTAEGGIGIHHFPGSREFLEGHVRMPLVHWLPKGNIRKPAIAFFLAIGYGPQEPWPETVDRGFWKTVEIYQHYLDHKTHYRDILDIYQTYKAAGFQAHWTVRRMNSKWRHYLPNYLRRNGFPRGSTTLYLWKGKISPVLESNLKEFS